MFIDFWWSAQSEACANKGSPILRGLGSTQCKLTKLYWKTIKMPFAKLWIPFANWFLIAIAAYPIFNGALFKLQVQKQGFSIIHSQNKIIDHENS